MATARSNCEAMTPILVLPAELGQAVLELLDPDDTVRLFEALQHARSVGGRVPHNFGFDWFGITEQFRTNMLQNAHFCNKMQSEFRRSRNPPNLLPDATSGLPQSQTYTQLLANPGIDRSEGMEKKKEQLKILRFELLFMSEIRRRNLDVPNPPARRRVGLSPNDTRNYAQIMQALPLGSTSEKDVSYQRTRDDRHHAQFQSNELEKILRRMEAEPGFLDRTCRKCYAHTYKIGDGIQCVKFNGTVFCPPCCDTFIRDAFIKLDSLLNLGSLINRTTGLLSSFSIATRTDRLQSDREHISRADADIFCKCFAGKSLVDVENKYLKQPRFPYFGLPLVDSRRFEFCSGVTQDARLWYWNKLHTGRAPVHHLPAGLTPAIKSTFSGDTLKLENQNSILKIYRDVELGYNDASLMNLNRQRYLEAQDKSVARFWHQQMFSHHKIIFTNVLIHQLKLPPYLCCLEGTGHVPQAISTSKAHELVRRYFGCSLGQMVGAVLSLEGTTLTIEMDIVMRRAALIEPVLENDRTLPKLFASLAVLGSALPSCIFGGPTHTDDHSWQRLFGIPQPSGPYPIERFTIENLDKGHCSEPYPSAGWFEQTYGSFDFRYGQQTVYGAPLQSSGFRSQYYPDHYSINQQDSNTSYQPAPAFTSQPIGYSSQLANFSSFAPTTGQGLTSSFTAGAPSPWQSTWRSTEMPYSSGSNPYAQPLSGAGNLMLTGPSSLITNTSAQIPLDNAYGNAADEDHRFVNMDVSMDNMAMDVHMDMDLGLDIDMMIDFDTIPDLLGDVTSGGLSAFSG